MRLLLLPWTAAVALQSSTLEVDEPPPVRRVFGADVRNCRAGAKTRTDEEAAVIGGHIVNDSTKYPFLTWIGDHDGTGMGQFCGGSLIHPRIVMTAAHCVYEDDYKNANIYVRFRLANFAKTKGVQRNIVNWKVHEGFNHLHLTNDIALFLLESDVTEDDGVYPVQLSDGTEPNEHETNATIVGWGSTDEECRIYDTFLRDSHVPIGPRGPACSTPGSKVLTKRDIDDTKQICAGYYVENSMEYPGCGDSGGPLLTYNGQTGNYTQVGFVSWSYGIPFPDVFTRVSAFRDWIDTTSEALIRAGSHPAANRPR